MSAACAGGGSDAAIVGKWKRADNLEITEFRGDGAFTRVATLRSPRGTEQKVTFGGNYKLPEDSTVQIEEGMGPTTYVLEMLGDSMFWRAPDGRRTKYYRDMGKQPSLTYRLRTVNGQALPYVYEREAAPGSRIPEKTEYRDGVLVLDPLTHRFTLTETRADGNWNVGPVGTMRIYGAYAENGDSLGFRIDQREDTPLILASRKSDTVDLQVRTEYPLLPAAERFRPGPALRFTKE
jgi:hypothetical protein